MKRNVVVPLLFIIFAAVIITLLLAQSLKKTLDSFDLQEPEGQYLVNANDIIKSSRVFLETRDAAMLSAALQQSGYILELYDSKGSVLFSNKEKATYGKKTDINNILSRTDPGEKILIIQPENNLDKEYAIAVIDVNKKKPEPDKIKNRVLGHLWILCAIFILSAVIVFILIYYDIIRPFKKLEFFAGELAKGNLEVTLSQDRKNLFGAFTWAFDMLRCELKTSREREAESEKTKKELVAALSHDIRTPTASIRAYAECLKSLPEKSSARGERYIDVILKKTDEITKLSQDMFMHAIMDLGKLEITPGAYQSRELLNDIIEPLILQYENRIVITSAIPDVGIITDKQRLAQVCGNIISNCAKYSQGSCIQINSYISEDKLICRFRDFGKGVSSEDIPFLFDRFYRGKNAKESGQPGSGLGLFISKYIMEKTEGGINAFNWHEDGESGFCTEIYIKIL